jgi:S-adenosylmethionine:tRNA ribosyltransferase-isomerase
MHSELATIPESTAEAINIAKKKKKSNLHRTTSTRSVESFWQEGKMQSVPNGQIFLSIRVSVSSNRCIINQFHLPKSTLLMMISAFAVLKQYKKHTE